ncbi:MAG: ROK family protein [Gemmatimonadales bacterium]|nr:ROK family protein [Gemmatimonadales bacterium]
MNEASLSYVLGIDIGGTNLVVGAVRDDGGQVVAAASRPTNPKRGPDAVIDEIIAMGRETLSALAAEVPGSKVIGLGIGSPGPLDTRRGVVLLTPNLGWVDMPVRDRLAGGLGLPAHLDNDANCAILGECWVGAGRGARCVIGLTIGTGIGGGIVVDGRLHHGVADCAGEIGHMTINVNGRRCGCGNDGCLEAYASGPAIAARAIEQLRAGASSRLTSLVDGDIDRVTAATVYEAAAAGDLFADEVVRDTARYLGVGVANLLNIFNPDRVVIAGGVTRAGNHLFEPLRREVARRAFRPAVDSCTIVPAALGDHAGVIGAARVFLDHQSSGAH